MFLFPHIKLNFINGGGRKMHVLNKETSEHCIRVSKMAYHTALACKLDYKICDEIRTAGLLHDVGKMKISSDILEKPGKLTDEEYSIVKMHAEYGAEILEKKTSDRIRSIILYHHENEDGTGYYNLANKDIPVGAKIIHVCDVYDALVYKRCYKQSIDHNEVLNWMKQKVGTMFDPKCFEAFANYVS